MSDLDRREDWQRYRAAMEIIANKFETTVYCSQKHSYLNVNFHTSGLPATDVSALSILEDLVMLVSGWPEGLLQRFDPLEVKVDTMVAKGLSPT